jgi:hypothetical protein
MAAAQEPRGEERWSVNLKIAAEHFPAGERMSLRLHTWATAEAAYPRALFVFLSV